MDYVDSFIAVADDCPVRRSAVPPAPPDKKQSVAAIQYALLAAAPYVYTQEDVLFQTYLRHKDIPAEEQQTHGDVLRAAFFAKPQPCLRASPLAKKYGWGFHFDHRGKVALWPMESSEYSTLAAAPPGGPTLMKAFRSSRV